MKIASDRIKELREEKGYTQRELAKKVGVHDNYIWRIENNSARGGSVLTFVKIAQELDCWVEDIVRRG